MDQQKVYEDYLGEIRERWSTELINITDVARWLGVDRRTLLRGRLPVKTLGRSTMVSAKSLARYLSN